MLAVILFVLQTPASDVSPPVKRSQQAVELVERARDLPAEFSADTLLRLAGSPIVTDKTWQEELIDEAYWSGGHSPLPYQQWADRRDSLPTRQVRANRLEALTLQTRAVESMLPLDPARALRMFETLDPLRLPDQDCAEVFTADVSAYYRTAGLLFESAFTSKQKQEEADLAFLKRLIGTVESPAEVPPALQMILALKVTPEKRIALLNALAGRLDHISGSDRAFGATEAALVPGPSPDAAAAPAFVAALGNYIRRQVRGRRCSDNIPAAGQLPKSVAQFNDFVAKLDPSGERFKPIAEAETKPVANDGTYPSRLLWKSPQSRSVLAALQWLHNGGRGPGPEHAWTLQERSTDEWLQHFQQTLKLLDDWKEPQEDSPDEYLCMVTDALSDLAALAPPGRIRDTAMAAYLEVLEDNYASMENRNLWFTQFRQMLYRARFSRDAAEKEWILKAMSRSKNPVISLYSRLEALNVAP